MSWAELFWEDPEASHLAEKGFMMNERRLLYFALGAMTVISVGAATDALVMRNEGIQYPDGTVQTTAAGLPRRMVYLTSTLVTGNMARDQCTEPGFHMASMWEIANWATLEYAKDVGGALSGEQLPYRSRGRATRWKSGLGEHGGRFQRLFNLWDR
jgi:hypothetical protein